ncbi:MAG: tRNA 2-selenouridine(34) synthase MnmH [Bacteroidota bacterium]
MIISIDEFLSLRDTLPIADVRSESEFDEGHIQGAVNIPILNNQERVEVGTTYKQQGQMAAIKAGFRLVGPRILDIVNNAENVAKERELLVHCWRGGMRSSNFCQFAEMAKIKTHQLAGGYKTYRQEALKSFRQPFQFIVIGGCTGSGKSEVLRGLAKRGEQIIDLEKLASHKGSVFGGLMMPPQPTTEQFENDLFETIRKLDVNRRIWIEDESIAVGKIFIPNDFWKNMSTSPVVEMEVDKPRRIERLVQEYGPADQDKFLVAMERIVKKLGGQHYKEAREKYLQQDMASTIDILLTYYDKAYGNSLLKKKHRVKTSLRWNGNNVDEFVMQLLSAVPST